MAINESTITRVRYPPELLADSRMITIPIGSEYTPALLEVKNFAPRLIRLRDIGVDQDDEVELRLKWDARRLAVNAGSLFDLLTNNYDLLARSELRYNLFASAVKNNYRTHFGLWVIEPTVADKLALGIPLSADEKLLDAELGISKSVLKGVHPLPLSYTIEREYQITHQETRGRMLDVTTTSLDVDTVSPDPGQFLVLTKLSTEPGTTAQNVRVRIDRDEDRDYLELQTYPLALAREIDLFIPALRELKVRVIGAAAAADFNIRFSFIRCRMTNILRVKWGLLSRAEAEETWKKAHAGVI